MELAVNSFHFGMSYLPACHLRFFYPYQVHENLDKRFALIASPGLETGFRLDKPSLLSYILSMGVVARCALPQLRAILVSLVCVFAYVSYCCSPYGPTGSFSETRIAPDIYRVSCSPYGYTSWDRLSGGIASLRCADYSERLQGFRRLSDRELRLGEQF